LGRDPVYEGGQGEILSRLYIDLSCLRGHDTDVVTVNVAPCGLIEKQMILLPKLDPNESHSVTFRVGKDEADWLASLTDELGCTRPTLCRYLLYLAKEYGGLSSEDEVKFRNRFTSHMDPESASKPRVSSAFVLLEEDYAQVVEASYLLGISYSKFVRDAIENHMNSWRVQRDVNKSRAEGRECPSNILEARRKKHLPNKSATGSA